MCVKKEKPTNRKFCTYFETKCRMFHLLWELENLGGYLAYRDLIGYLTNGIIKNKDLIENSNKKD